ncbi:MAG TPA: hypothetical protein VGN52_00755 [Burkholderiales bacterium]|jgi:hypothetical protein
MTAVAQVYAKTGKAVEEIQTKKYKLKPKARNLLFLIDGSKSVESIDEMSRQLGLSADELGELESGGFIVKSGSEGGVAAAAVHEEVQTDEAGKFRVAKKYMNDTIVNSLGLKAFFFTLKLEKCGTRADLAALLEDYGQALAKASNVETAKVLQKRARELLA